MMDLSRKINRETYLQQLEQIVTDYEFLMQLSFDIIDANGDGKISQMDIFKVLRQFDQDPVSDWCHLNFMKSPTRSD